VRDLEAILRLRNIDIPREATLATSPSPLRHKREPHEIYLQSNYTDADNVDENLSASDFGANNFDDYQQELDHPNSMSSPPKFAQSSTKQ